MITVYLDSNHISSIARHPESPDNQAFLQMLEKTRCYVALSIVHLIELSDPRFLSFSQVQCLVDALPVVWALAPDDLWQAEVESAFAQFVGGCSVVKAFVFDVGSMLSGSPTIAPASMALSSFRDPELRQSIEQSANQGLAFEMLKKEATIVREPKKLLAKMILERQPERTPSGLQLPRKASPDEIFAAVGGLAGFPSYSLMRDVAAGRLRDKTFRPKRSDVFDLMHVAYAAYATYTALDRSHASRVRAARRDLAGSVTSHLHEITTWLGRHAF